MAGIYLWTGSRSPMSSLKMQSLVSLKAIGASPRYAQGSSFSFLASPSAASPASAILLFRGESAPEDCGASGSGSSSRVQRLLPQMLL